MRLASAVSTVILMGLTFSTYAKDEGFAGRWVLDRSAQLPPDGPGNLETRIKQDHSGLTIESTFKEPDSGVVPLLYLGVMATKVRLSLDGNLQQNAIGPFQMGSKTTVNGKQLDTEWTAVVKGDSVQGHWTHTLSDDGRHMTLEIKENSTQGQGGQATLHFVKK